MSAPRTPRIVVGLVALSALVGAMAMPASANTVGVTVTGGSFELYDSGSSLVDTHALAGGTTCSPAASTVVTSGSASSGSVSITIQSDTAVSFAGDDWRVVEYLSLTGSYAGAGQVAIATGSASSVWTKTTGPGSCTDLWWIGPCTVSSSSLVMAGQITAADPSTLVTGDTLAGTTANGAGDTTVSGSWVACGGLAAANGGWTLYDGLTLAVV